MNAPAELPSRLKLTTVWLLIGLVLFLAIQWWQQRARAARIHIANGVIELQRGDDGHYHWPGRINGREVVFLVDTGATGTALPKALANDLALPTQGRVVSSTAGGDVIGTTAQVEVELQGGVQARNLRVTVLPKLEGPLLGMDVLGKMRFTQQDGVLRLEPPRP